MITCNPPITLRNLRLCFDLANPKCYSGVSPLTDLSRTSLNATGSFPSYLSSNYGLFQHNRTKFVNFCVPNLSNKISVEIWCKPTGSYAPGAIFGFNIYSLVIDGSNNLGYNTGAGDTYGIMGATFTSLLIPNNWNHFVCIMNDNVSYSNNKIYLNGNRLSLSQVGGTENTSFRNFNNGSGKIGGWMYNADLNTEMQYSIFRIYNDELTSGEIVQNFNANRNRFGI